MKPLLPLALLALVTAMASPAQARSIGTAAAVTPDATAGSGSGARRIVRIGQNVVYGERIETSASGSVQLLFVDRTTLNIGPNSSVVIDAFVFDPASNTGRMAATLTKGALRFVGGQASHTGGATIRTPSTTLGVRGGVASIRHDQKTGTRVISHFGTVTAETANGQEVLRRAGMALTIAPGGVPGGGVQQATRAEFDAAIAGRSGGRPASGSASRSSKAGGKNSAADDAAAVAASASQQALSNRLKSFVPPPHTGPGRPDPGGDGNGAGDGGDRSGSGGGEARGNRYGQGGALPARRQ